MKGNALSWRVALCAAALLVGACATTAPVDFLDIARQTYKRASAGPAARLAPDKLKEARTALDAAEAAFKKHPEALRTQDLAYVADRKASIAEAAGDSRIAEEDKGQVMAAYFQGRADAALAMAEKLETVTSAEVKGLKDQIAQERQESEATTEIAKLAGVKRDERGLVITMSDGILFAVGQAKVLPEARARLSQIAVALIKTNPRGVVIEGHTDATGSAKINLDLSQRRADAVLAYMTSLGFPEDKIIARGIGADRPVADNGAEEGRAKNRRVEIVVATTMPR